MVQGGLAGIWEEMGLCAALKFLPNARLASYPIAADMLPTGSKVVERGKKELTMSLLRGEEKASHPRVQCGSSQVIVLLLRALGEGDGEVQRFVANHGLVVFPRGKLTCPENDNQKVKSRTKLIGK